MDNFNYLILFLLIASTLQPLLQARLEAMRRARRIAAIEKERGSRVITMIHRQETRWFFSLPVSRMIDLEDAQQIIPAIKETPADTPIDIILHTPGGMVLAAMQIALLLAMPDEPDEDWTERQWEELRNKVSRALRDSRK